MHWVASETRIREHPQKTKVRVGAARVAVSFGTNERTFGSNRRSRASDRREGKETGGGERGFNQPSREASPNG